MIEIDDSESPVSEVDLLKMEEELGEKIPTQYRKFLLKFNGGTPSPDIVDIEGLSDSPTDVQEFFGIGVSDESSDLSWNKEVFSDRIPARMLPIACDSGNNVFCVSLSGNDQGKIFYVDLQSGESTQYLVAESFDNFLSNIRGWE